MKLFAQWHTELKQTETSIDDEIRSKGSILSDTDVRNTENPGIDPTLFIYWERQSKYDFKIQFK